MRLAHRLQMAKGLITPPTSFELHFLWLEPFECKSCYWTYQQGGLAHCLTCLHAWTLDGEHDPTDTDNWRQVGS